MYELVNAHFKDKKILKEFKLKLTNKKISDDLKYKKINKDINKTYSKYKLIIVDDKIVGCLLLLKNEIYEIYIIEEYRCLGIGTDIIKNIINIYKETYLWVFKDNKKALKLYKKLGFKVIKETNESYYMRVYKYGAK